MKPSLLVSPQGRIRLLYVLIVAVSVIFIFRLFYLQVLRHDFYQTEATQNQLKQYVIPAERGSIYFTDGEGSIPAVLNEARYNIVADPQVVQDKDSTATKLSEVLGIPRVEIYEHLQADNRYEIISKKQTKVIKEEVQQLMFDGDITGVFAIKTTQRVYPYGTLASQLLGFVDDTGEGRYGVEESLNPLLAGTEGRVKALTDKNGVPLLASGDNILEDPIDGSNVLLSIDVAMQRQVENILKKGLEHAQSDSGSVIIMDPFTGQVRAMANLPTYDPAKFADVKDLSVFQNAAVSSTVEPGSTMKVFTAAAALDSGSATEDQTYYDPSFYIVNDFRIHNIAEDGGAGTKSVSDILNLSLNTGATWLLMQMGGGEINLQARQTWYDYMVNHYRFNQKTGIEQGFEETGLVPEPDDGYALNLKFANTAFGQGMNLTSIQMASALSSVVNGGTYYQPTLVSGSILQSGEIIKQDPKIVGSNVVSKEVSDAIIKYMDNVVTHNNYAAVRTGYRVGGKTGTAQVADPSGGYYDSIFNGTYVGYVGGDLPQYVIMVKVDKPRLRGYAGSQAAGPIFASVSNMLIDNFSIRTKSGQ